jgi:hypothetical protein
MKAPPIEAQPTSKDQSAPRSTHAPPGEQQQQDQGVRRSTRERHPPQRFGWDDDKKEDKNANKEDKKDDKGKKDPKKK